MLAQLYMALLIDEGSLHRSVDSASLRRQGLTREERRMRRSLEDQKR